MAELQKLIRPLATNPASVMPAFALYNGYSAIGVNGGGKPSANPREWRISCKGRLSGNLFELWMPYQGGKKFYLHSFCLNIYDVRTASTDPPEFLLLHADPETRLTEPHGRYKKGPHIHVEVPHTVWPDVHLGLNLGNLREATSSPKNISIALKHAIDMIEDQITAHKMRQ